MNNDNPSQSSSDKIFPAYFDHYHGCYWVQDERGDFIKIREQDLKRRLRSTGVSAQVSNTKGVSPLDEKILDIQNKHSVSYAAPLAGYFKGLHEISGQRILVTTSPILIEPRPGEWPVLAKLLANLFGDQTVYFYGWMKHANECLRTGQRAPGQALVIVGEHDSGKSLVQNLITLMLGGRSEKPYRYMSGDTPFNAELFRAEHLMIEDEPASRDLRTRKKFGAQIKMIVAAETQSCHAKGRTAITLTPHWRLTVTLNSEPENILILPPLDDSLEDKIILLKGTKHPMPMPTNSLAERKLFWKTLEGELPAFIDFLQNWQIPQSLQSERFRITHYHHPEIRRAIDTLAPETRLLDMLDTQFFLMRENAWEGTAAELERELRTSSDTAREAAALLDFPSATGTYLGRLALSNPKRVEKLTSGNGNRWRISLPEE